MVASTRQSHLAGRDADNSFLGGLVLATPPLLLGSCHVAKHHLQLHQGSNCEQTASAHSASDQLILHILLTFTHQPVVFAADRAVQSVVMQG